MSNYNGKPWLDECLHSVLALDYPNFEVVVVDNGSVDQSTEHVQAHFPAVTVITLARNRGYAGGINAGLVYAAAQGADYFLIMNNDTVIDRDALAAMVEVARTHPAAGRVTGKVYFYDQPDILQTVGKLADPVRIGGEQIGERERDEGQYDSVAERAYTEEIFCLVSRELYDQVGGYDAGLYIFGEDVEWQARSRERGWRIYYTPHAKLWHRVGMDTGGSFDTPTKQYFFLRNSIMTLHRHGSRRRFLRFYLGAATESSFSLLKGLAQGDREKIRSRLARWLGFWGGTGWLVHRRPANGVPRHIQLLSR
jgi:GT2 family glycosyltransferase